MTDYWKSLGADPAAGQRAQKPNIESNLMFVEPVLTRYWLEYCHYKHQRHIRDYHVDRLVRALLNDTFETSEVNFYDYGEGPKCVNGVHRLTAIAKAQKGAWLTVTLHQDVTEAETREAYRRYDVGLMRGLSEILRSAEIAEELNLSALAAQRLNSAAALIYYRFDQNMWHGARSEFRDYEQVLDRIRLWAHEGREYTRAVQMARGGLRRNLQSRAVMAVALVTYRHQADRAPYFWQDVATNSGLTRGQPAHTLVNYLADTVHARHNVNTIMRAVAGAWNAFYLEKQIRQIHIPDPHVAINIEGTPFHGMRGIDESTLNYAVAPSPTREAVLV
jgi:hypothetical protein